MITDYLKYVNDQAYVVKREVNVHVFEVKGQNKLNMELLAAYRMRPRFKNANPLSNV